MSSDAEPDHQSAQHEGAEDAPEEHPVLLGERHPEIAEHHRDDEDVVDRKRILDHVAGKKLQRGLAAGMRRADVPAGRIEFVEVVDADIEEQGQRDPGRRPAERLGQCDDVRLAVKNTEIQGNDQGDQQQESAPYQQTECSQMQALRALGQRRQCRRAPGSGHGRAAVAAGALVGRAGGRRGCRARRRVSQPASGPSADFNGPRWASKLRHCSRPWRYTGWRTCSELGVRTGRSVS